jgi:hypothetical protein
MYLLESASEMDYNNRYAVISLQWDITFKTYFDVQIKDAFPNPIPNPIPNPNMLVGYKKCCSVKNIIV